MNAVARVRGSANRLVLLAMVALSGLFGFVGSAMATTPTASDDILAAIQAGQADAVKIAVGVVIALWAIWAIYLMRRKG